MRKGFPFLLVLVFFLMASCIMVAKSALPSINLAEDLWVSKAPMREAKSDFGTAVVNGKIYIIGGSTRSGQWPYTGGIVGTNEEYDPANDTWTLKKPMPTPREGFATLVYKSKIYCIGGIKNYPKYGSPTYSRLVEVYDPATNKWENKTPMPSRRENFATIVHQNKFYFMGDGINEVYDPATDTWENRTSIPFNISWTCANVVNDKIYFVIYTLNYVYNPATDSWTTKALMPTGAYSAASAVVDNKISVISSNLNQIYDPETDKWSLGALPPSSVRSWSVVTSGEMAPKRVYCFDETRRALDIYDAEADSWAIGANLLTDRKGFGVAVVNDLIYVIGGNTYTQTQSTILPYYPDVFVTPHATNEQYTPIGYGTVAPKISVISPENKNYTSGDVSLVFTVNKPALWMGYSLDGQETVTVTGNTTLAELTSGLHNVTVYAKDEFENTGASETIHFTTTKEPEPLPAALTAIAATVSVIAIAAVLLIYFKKRCG